MATKSITKEAFLVMKRCFSLLLAIVMALAATACGAKPRKVDPAAFCIQESVALTQEMGAMAANQMYMDLVSDSKRRLAAGPSRPFSARLVHSSGTDDVSLCRRDVFLLLGARTRCNAVARI